ncbi:hypothetical protein [Marinospirillum sp.]|uniref:hypothetical protein n=1 Tax=Marinospirillum sp. TaxID=2183934 RepID=UPI00287049C8|nr:hypothetical protein [Marinospirillum sp.]MDR9468360.1 hypothetical protein [Marinospirillum sp.]
MTSEREWNKKIQAIIEAAKRLIIQGEKVTGEALAFFFEDEEPEFLEKIWQDLFTNNPEIARIRLSDRVAVELEKHFESQHVPIYHKAQVIEEVRVRT